MNNGDCLADPVTLKFLGSNDSMILESDLLDLKLAIEESWEMGISELRLIQKFRDAIKTRCSVELTTSQAAKIYYHVEAEYAAFLKKNSVPLQSQGSTGLIPAVSTVE